MPRTRVTIDALISAAVDIADRAGFDKLALTGVAAELNIAASTLYTHVDGLNGLRNLVAIAATQNLGDAVRTAAIGTAGADALRAMAVAYRTFALDHPGQFASTLLLPRTHDDDLSTAKAAVLSIFVLVYRGMSFGEQEARRAARATRSAIHGFLALEGTTSPASEHDADYLHLVDALQHGLLHAHSIQPTVVPRG